MRIGSIVEVGAVRIDHGVNYPTHLFGLFRVRLGGPAPEQIVDQPLENEARRPLVAMLANQQHDRRFDEGRHDGALVVEDEPLDRAPHNGAAELGQLEARVGGKGGHEGLMIGIAVGRCLVARGSGGGRWIERDTLPIPAQKQVHFEPLVSGRGGCVERAHPARLFPEARSPIIPHPLEDQVKLGADRADDFDSWPADPGVFAGPHDYRSVASPLEGERTPRFGHVVDRQRIGEPPTRQAKRGDAPGDGGHGGAGS